MNNLTLLIQGPVDRTSLDVLNKYKQYGKVVISTWNNCDDIDTLLEYDVFNICDSVVFNILPDVQKILDQGRINKTFSKKPCTFHYSVFSTYYGLLNCKTKYVLKLRSDEFISNLQPMINSIKKNPNCLIMSNVITRTDIKYHMGDHFFLCKTRTLLKAYKLIMDFHINGIEIDNFKSHAVIVPEILLSNSIMKAMKLEVNIDNYKKSFIEININKMQPYIVRNNHENRMWENNYA